MCRDGLPRVAAVLTDPHRACRRTKRERRARRVSSRLSWLPSGHAVLETEQVATLAHPDTGARAWFNQAHLFRLSPRYLGHWRYQAARALSRLAGTPTHHTSFGDGSHIERGVIEHVMDVLDAHAVPVTWQRGDLLWVDNLVSMHGRRPFSGDRRVLVALTGRARPEST